MSYAEFRGYTEAPKQFSTAVQPIQPLPREGKETHRSLPRHLATQGTKEWAEEVVVFVGRDIRARGRVSVAAPCRPAAANGRGGSVGLETLYWRHVGTGRIFLTFSFLLVFTFSLFAVQISSFIYALLSFSYSLRFRKGNSLIYLSLWTMTVKSFFFQVYTMTHPHLKK